MPCGCVFSHCADLSPAGGNRLSSRPLTIRMHPLNATSRWDLLAAHSKGHGVGTAEGVARLGEIEAASRLESAGKGAAHQGRAELFLERHQPQPQRRGRRVRGGVRGQSSGYPLPQPFHLPFELFNPLLGPPGAFIEFDWISFDCQRGILLRRLWWSSPVETGVMARLSISFSMKFCGPATSPAPPPLGAAFSAAAFSLSAARRDSASSARAARAAALAADASSCEYQQHRRAQLVAQ